MSTFAEKQLAKFGWQKGQGLGKREDGISKAVKVEQKLDTYGIGLKEERTIDHSFQWWDHAFNKAINNIQVTNEVTGNSNAGDFNISIKRKRELKRSDIVSYKRQLVKKPEQQSSVNGFIKQDINANAVIEYEEVLESTAKMTDAELFNACGGRTAHKGARSSMNGKLYRAQQIGLGLPSITPSSLLSDNDDDDKKVADTKVTQKEDNLEEMMDKKERKRLRREKRRLKKEAKLKKKQELL